MTQQKANTGQPWIGFDLDGTLAEYGMGDPGIGKPIPLAMERLRRYIIQGKRVKIFTARASVPELIPEVKAWLKKQDLPDLEITCQKDFLMKYFYDDRAIQVEINTGRRIDRKD